MTACQPQNVNAAKRVREEPDLAGALDDVVRGREQRAAAEREDHRVRVQRRSRPYEKPRDVEIQLGQSSWAAMITPTSIPQCPDTVMTVNWRTTL